MKLKKEYQDILNNLELTEKETILKMLERIDAVVKKDNYENKSRVYQIIKLVHISLKENSRKWIVNTFKLVFAFTLVFTIQAILCTQFDWRPWSEWFYNDIYLVAFNEDNILKILIQLVFNAGVFSIVVYVCVRALVAVGLLLFKSNSN